MRLRSPSHIIFATVSLAVAVYSSRATAQIEFAKSTIRIVSTGDGTQKTESPVKSAVQQVEFVEPIEQQPAVGEHATVAMTPPAPQAAPPKQYPVRQADFVTAPAPQPQAYAPAPTRAPSKVNVYSSSNAQSTLSKLPRPAPVYRQSTTTAPPKLARGKPFQSAQSFQSEPVISPYMNLYRNDDGITSGSNYLTMVRPQQEQQQAYRQQAAEIQKLRTQLQNMSSGSAPNSGSMSAHAHYMDTAQFYKGTRR